MRMRKREEEEEARIDSIKQSKVQSHMFVRPSLMAKENTSVLPLLSIIETCSEAEIHPVQSYVSYPNNKSYQKSP